MFAQNVIFEKSKKQIYKDINKKVQKKNLLKGKVRGSNIIPLNSLSGAEIQ